MKLKNNYKYIGDDRWDWELYIDSNNPEELSSIREVKYILHPTFKNPVRTVKKEEGGFRLKSNGWGTFETKAMVYLNNGEKLSLKHDLELQYPDTDYESDVNIE